MKNIATIILLVAINSATGDVVANSTINNDLIANTTTYMDPRAASVEKLDTMIKALEAGHSIIDANGELTLNPLNLVEMELHLNDTIVNGSTLEQNKLGIGFSSNEEPQVHDEHTYNDPRYWYIEDDSHIHHWYSELGKEHVNGDALFTMSETLYETATNDLINQAVDKFYKCGWVLTTSGEGSIRQLLDQNMVWQTAIIPRLEADEYYTIEGTFPDRIRYMSFHTYEYESYTAGVTHATDGITDFQIEPEEGSGQNPYSTIGGEDNPGKYKVHLTQYGDKGFKNEIKGLREGRKSDFVLLVMYLVLPNAKEDEVNGIIRPNRTEDLNPFEWGYVDPPVIKRYTYKRENWGHVMPICGPLNFENEVMSVIDEIIYNAYHYNYIETSSPSCIIPDTAGNMIVFRGWPYDWWASQFRSILPIYDGGYLWYCHPAITHGQVFRITGRLPLTPDGFKHGNRIADNPSYDRRYISFTSMDGHAPTANYQTINDFDIKLFYKDTENNTPEGTRYEIIMGTSEVEARNCGLLNDHNMWLPMMASDLNNPKNPGVIYRDFVGRNFRTGEKGNSVYEIEHERCFKKPELAELVINGTITLEPGSDSFEDWYRKAENRDFCDHPEDLMKEEAPKIEMFQCLQDGTLNRMNIAYNDQEGDGIYASDLETRSLTEDALPEWGM